MSRSEELYNGYLWKLSATGNLIKHWTKRHFVLTTTTLQYAETRDSIRRKTYFLKDIISSSEVGERKLEVKFAERTFLLRAEDSYDRAFWLDNIRKACKALAEGGSSPRSTLAGGIVHRAAFSETSSSEESVQVDGDNVTSRQQRGNQEAAQPHHPSAPTAWTTSRDLRTKELGMWVPRDPVASAVGNTARTDWRHRLPTSLSAGAPGSPPSPVERTEVVPFDAPFDLPERVPRESDAQQAQPPPLPAKPFSLVMGAGGGAPGQRPAQRGSAPAFRHHGLTAADDDDDDDSGDDWNGAPPTTKDTAPHVVGPREPADAKPPAWLHENFDSDSDGEASGGPSAPRSGHTPPYRQPHIPAAAQPISGSMRSGSEQSASSQQGGGGSMGGGIGGRSSSEQQPRAPLTWDDQPPLHRAQSQPRSQPQPRAPLPPPAPALHLSEELQAHDLYDVRPAPSAYHRGSDDGSRDRDRAAASSSFNSQSSSLGGGSYGQHYGQQQQQQAPSPPLLSQPGLGPASSHYLAEPAVPPQTQTQQKMQAMYHPQHPGDHLQGQGQGGPPQLPPPPPKPDYMRVEQSHYAMLQQQQQPQPQQAYPPQQQGYAQQPHPPVLPPSMPMGQPPARRGRQHHSSSGSGSAGELPQASSAPQNGGGGLLSGLPPRAPSAGAELQPQYPQQSRSSYPPPPPAYGSGPSPGGQQQDSNWVDEDWDAE